MENKTIRLIFPQWIGGNRHVYGFGAKLLEWLAPPSEIEIIEFPLFEETTAPIVDGIAFKTELIQQSKEVYHLLTKKSPDKVVTLGGDCSISLAPFIYLLEKYREDVAVLWVDRHGDISITGETTDYHAMILASLLGEGDSDFCNLVNYKLQNDKLLHIGVNDPEKEFGRKIGEKYKFKNILPEEFEHNSDRVISKINEMNVSKVMIHFDLE